MHINIYIFRGQGLTCLVNSGSVSPTRWLDNFRIVSQPARPASSSRLRLSASVASVWVRGTNMSTCGRRRPSAHKTFEAK